MVDFGKHTKAGKELSKALEEENVSLETEVTISQSLGSKTDSMFDIGDTQSRPEITREILTTKEFKEGQYSKVKVNCGHTLSLGDFMFYRCDVGIEDFCRPNEKEIALEEIKETAKSFLLKEVQKVKARNSENREKKRKRYK